MYARLGQNQFLLAGQSDLGKLVKIKIINRTENTYANTNWRFCFDSAVCGDLFL